MFLFFKPLSMTSPISDTSQLSDTNEGVQIAYFILVHRLPNQFRRLFRAIYSPNDHYLIHIDKRAGEQLYEEIRVFLSAYPNTYLLESQSVVWGGYSMVSAELRGIEKLLELDLKWDFYINLSGQDFPIKSSKVRNDFLKRNKGKDFMIVSNQFNNRPSTMNRIENYFTESETGFIGSPYERSYMPYTTPYIGGQWKILSRECCQFITNSPMIGKFRDYYENTLIPDESFFQTVLMNTDSGKNIIADDKRAIIWIPEIGPELASKVFTESETTALIESGEIKLRPKTLMMEDLPFLLVSDALFARKFDEIIDTEVLSELEKIIF